MKFLKQLFGGSAELSENSTEMAPVIEDPAKEAINAKEAELKRLQGNFNTLVENKYSDSYCPAILAFLELAKAEDNARETVLKLLEKFEEHRKSNTLQSNEGVMDSVQLGTKLYAISNGSDIPIKLVEEIMEKIAGSLEEICSYATSFKTPIIGVQLKPSDAFLQASEDSEAGGTIVVGFESWGVSGTQQTLRGKVICASEYPDDDAMLSPFRG